MKTSDMREHLDVMEIIETMTGHEPELEPDGGIVCEWSVYGTSKVKLELQAKSRNDDDSYSGALQAVRLEVCIDPLRPAGATHTASVSATRKALLEKFRNIVASLVKGE